MRLKRRYTYTDAKSQKARGILLLSQLYFYGEECTLRALLVRTEEDAESHWNLFRPCFARPCPVQARHGFLDSRVVTSAADLRNLLAEVKQVEPEGEIILMPKVDAVASAILTEAFIAVGPGHDGATGGKKGCHTYPLAGADLRWCERALQGGKPGEVPYVEAVLPRGGGATRLVQVRSGPQPPSGVSSRGHVPQDTEVQRVLFADPDETDPAAMLRWEQEVALAPKEGTVVWHPGGTMLSHYAVHGVLSGLPVLLTGRKPSIGEVIPKTAGTRAPRWHTRSWLRGLNLGLNTDLTDHLQWRYRVETIVFVLHHSSQLITETWGAKALGLAVGYMIRLGYTAAVGEYRHADPTRREHPRDDIYREFLAGGKTFLQCRARVGFALWSFEHLTWSGSYGGRKWAACVRATMALEEAARSRNPDFREVVKALNRAVNQAHNNGWWLNKFRIQEESLTRAAAGDAVALVDGAWGLHRFLWERPPSRGAIRNREWFAAKEVEGTREPGVVFRYALRIAPPVECTGCGAPDNALCPCGTADEESCDDCGDTVSECECVCDDCECKDCVCVKCGVCECEDCVCEICDDCECKDCVCVKCGVCEALSADCTCVKCGVCGGVFGHTCPCPAVKTAEWVKNNYPHLPACDCPPCEKGKTMLAEVREPSNIEVAKERLEKAQAAKQQYVAYNDIQPACGCFECRQGAVKLQSFDGEITAAEEALAEALSSGPEESALYWVYGVEGEPTPEVVMAFRKHLHVGSSMALYWARRQSLDVPVDLAKALLAAGGTVAPVPFPMWGASLPQRTLVGCFRSPEVLHFQLGNAGKYNTYDIVVCNHEDRAAWVELMKTCPERHSLANSSTLYRVFDGAVEQVLKLTKPPFVAWLQEHGFIIENNSSEGGV